MSFVPHPTLTNDVLLGNSASTVSATANPNHARQTGQEFEAVFFSLLLKSMRTSMTENGLFSEEGSDTYGGLFDLYMGRQLAASSSLGIGQMLESYLTQSMKNQEIDQK